MKRFQQNMNRELRRAYPDRRKLENQCICCVGFVKDSNDLLDLPVWIMIINIVAMDMLKSKMPLTISKRQSVPNLVSLFDRQKSTIAEEDPYSIPGNNSSSSGSRSSGHYVSTGPFSSGQNGLNGESKTSSLSPPSSSGDDPYYSGFSARVPNFARKTNGNLTSYGNPQPLMPFKSSYNHPDFHSRKVPTSGFLNSFLKSPNVIHSRTASYQSYYGSLGLSKRSEAQNNDELN
ncbi:hypothetical protein QR98_0066290 [Sarcoptes scabiei]|uniref:Uncharacterized protein n=1 Tax=Sarcoptes scabiei TaxID=52283 RepID=A0A132AC14_SARSC|nr:hypothetical protein QR98_0066290 [Sarcoptes scabiei]